MARRLPSFVGLIGVAFALALLSAPPAVAAPTQPQTVTFTSTAPEGADWFGTGYGAFDYIASASASSGLPVTYSIDPASANVCRIYGEIGSQSGVYVGFLGPGTCTIHADQAGNDEYLPADQASQSFVLDRVKPTLAVLKQTNWPGRKRTFRATMVVPVAWNHWGYLEDQVITFFVGGRPVCSGTTSGNGVATCTATLTVLEQLRHAFVASYAGDPLYKPVSRNGPTGESKDPVQAEPW